MTRLDPEKENFILEISLNAVAFAIRNGCKEIDGITIAALASWVLNCKEIIDRRDQILAMRWSTELFIKEIAKIPNLCVNVNSNVN